MPTLTCSPNPVPPSTVVSVAGATFANAKTRLRLDGVGEKTNIFRPKRDGTFSVGLTVSTTARTQTLVAEQLSGSTWREVARTSIVVQAGTVTPPSRRALAGVASARGVANVSSLTITMGPPVVTPPAGGYPPNGTWLYTPTPTLAMPGYRVAVADPTYGTEVTRVGNAPLVAHSYQSMPAWNADGSLMALGYGSSAWARMVDGHTYADLYSIGSDLEFAGTDPAMAFRRSGVTILRYAASMSSIAVAQTYDLAALGGYSQISFGGGQGAPSDDGRYIALQWKKANNDVGLAVLDTTLGTIHASLTMGNSTASLTTILNACGMSHSGGYLYLENGPQDVAPGGNVFAGGWIYDRDLNTSTRRQVTYYTRHFDWGWDHLGREVVATCSQLPTGYDGVHAHAGTYRVSDGQWTDLTAPIYAYYNGHISGRAKDRPGWFYLSHFTAGASSGTWESLGAIIAVSHADPTIVQYFGHTHHNTNPGYDGEPQACPSPDGKKVAFRSPWTPENTDGSIYGFVMGMDVNS